MTFTKDQMEVLAQYEGALRRAHFSRYCNALPKAAYNTLANIYDEAANTNVPRNPNCQSCLFFLLDRLGAAYFAQKALDEVVESDVAELEPLMDLQGESKPQAKTNYKGKRGARGVRVGKVKA